MNRHARRAAAARAKRDGQLAYTLASLAEMAAADPTISGATVILPGEEPFFVSAETALAAAADRPKDSKPC